jgi:hypothetical protein
LADLRAKKANWEAKGQPCLEAHARADQEGAAVSIAESRAAPDKGQEQMARVEKQAARLDNVLAPREPKRGKRGQARPRKVPDNDSAKMQTAPGVMPGENGPARVDSTPQVIVHAEALGNGPDYGPVAPR